jgi:hypothetical protein
MNQLSDHCVSFMATTPGPSFEWFEQLDLMYTVPLFPFTLLAREHQDLSEETRNSPGANGTHDDEPGSAFYCCL